MWLIGQEFSCYQGELQWIRHQEIINTVYWIILFTSISNCLKWIYQTILTAPFAKAVVKTLYMWLMSATLLKRIWSKLRQWVCPELNLPVLTPQNAILGILAKDAPFDLLLNHILILFRQGLYQCRNTNIPPNFYQIKEKIRLIQKIEYKIARDNDCLFSHLRKWENIM